MLAETLEAMEPTLLPVQMVQGCSLPHSLFIYAAYQGAGAGAGHEAGQGLGSRAFLPLVGINLFLHLVYSQRLQIAAIRSKCLGLDTLPESQPLGRPFVPDPFPSGSPACRSAQRIPLVNASSFFSRRSGTSLVSPEIGPWVPRAGRGGHSIWVGGRFQKQGDLRVRHGLDTGR